MKKLLAFLLPLALTLSLTACAPRDEREDEMRSILQSQSSISIRRKHRTRSATPSRSRICIRRRKQR